MATSLTYGYPDKDHCAVSYDSEIKQFFVRFWSFETGVEHEFVQGSARETAQIILDCLGNRFGVGAYDKRWTVVFIAFELNRLAAFHTSLINRRANYFAE